MPMRHVIGRHIPVQLVQRLCNNTLYDQRCKADPNLFARPITISGVSGLTFTITGYGSEPGYYSGGYIEGADLPMATIKEDLGATIKMLYNPGYQVGDAVNMYPGCDKRKQTCVYKFDNIIHFQGYPFMPTKDPFLEEIT
jgi:uncharacterized phage protein (TIGR02218 family)